MCIYYILHTLCNPPKLQTYKVHPSFHRFCFNSTRCLPFFFYNGARSGKKSFLSSKLVALKRLQSLICPTIWPKLKWEGSWKGKHKCLGKHKKSRPEFDLGLSCSYSTMTSTTPHRPPLSLIIYIKEAGYLAAFWKRKAWHKVEFNLTTLYISLVIKKFQLYRDFFLGIINWS